MEINAKYRQVVGIARLPLPMKAIIPPKRSDICTLSERLTGTHLAWSAYERPSSRGLGHRPFTAVTGVRNPLGRANKITHFAMYGHRLQTNLQYPVVSARYNNERDLAPEDGQRFALDCDAAYGLREL